MSYLEDSLDDAYEDDDAPLSSFSCALSSLFEYENRHGYGFDQSLQLLHSLGICNLNGQDATQEQALSFDIEQWLDDESPSLPLAPKLLNLRHHINHNQHVHSLIHSTFFL